MTALVGPRLDVAEPRVLVAEASEDRLRELLPSLEGWTLVSVVLEESKVLELAEVLEPDLILLSLDLPPRGGLEVLRGLRQDSRHRRTPVLLLVEGEDRDLLRRGFSLGASDALAYPLLSHQVQARVRAYLGRRAEGDRRGDEESLLRREEISRAQDTLAESLSYLAECRNVETGRHILRTRSYVRLLGDFLARSGHRTGVPVALLEKGAALHDIGKVGIPDSVLMKPGKLEPGEFAVMQRHAELGRDVLLHAERRMGRSPFLRVARQIAHTHHERWDGTGYPQGLAGDRIPLPGRIMALADVYDALVSRRVYKDPCSHLRAVQILAEERGRQFDPDLVDLFLRIHPLFEEVAHRFADEEESPDRSFEPFLASSSLHL